MRRPGRPKKEVVGHLRCGFCSTRTEVIVMRDKHQRWHFRAACRSCGTVYLLPTFRAKLLRIHSIEIEAAI